MGTWGIESWSNDPAADWFDAMFEATGLALHVEETLHRDIDEYAQELRAAVFVLLVLGRPYVWPVGQLQWHLALAAARLEEILVAGVFQDSETVLAIESELAEIRSRLPQKA